MATKKWALDSEGNLFYIDNANRETDGFCIGCGEKLIYNKGVHHCDAYWRHSNKSQCQGGSAETLVHKLSKEVILNGTVLSIEVPASYYIVSTKNEIVSVPFIINLNDYEIDCESFIPNASIKPDITLKHKYSDFYIYLEIRNQHKVSEKTLNRYRELRNIQNFSFMVVEIDVRECVLSLEENNLSELVQTLSGGFKDKIEVIMSNKLAELQIENKGSFFEYNSKYADCPNGGIVTPTICSECPYLISKKGNNVKCNGKLAYLSVNDILHREKRDKTDRLDLNPVPSSDLELVNSLDLVKERMKPAYYEGKCKKCGKSTLLVTGNNAGSVPNILQKPTFKDNSGIEHCVDLELEKWCPHCDKYEKIYCPCCNKRKVKVPITVWNNNNNGNIYARCSEMRDGGCGYSITLFKDSSCTEYAEELVYSGGIDTFVNKPVLFKNLMMKARPIIKNILSKN